ncbi:trypsin inhibitor like cysteine rich domain-containing protein [Phthorimaea operculella]|nr:trypsin inhibitor like cysteine rich domain-containing protein [Phthorimaea operculella]
MSLVLESVLAKIHPTLLCMVTISFAFRTDVCTGENEEFSLCSWRCPPTCVTMRLMISHPEILCPYRWQCRVGCRCSAGFIWDEHSKRCVRNIECPGK